MVPDCCTDLQTTNLVDRDSSCITQNPHIGLYFTGVLHYYFIPKYANDGYDFHPKITFMHILNNELIK